MNIGEIKKALNCYNENMPVVAWDKYMKQFCYLTRDFGSYRGYYNQPCIYTVTYFDDNSIFSVEDILEQQKYTKLVDVGDVLWMLEKLTSEEFTGYKGGEYRYDDSDPLNLAPYGSTDKVVVKVKEEHGIVFLRCAEAY